MAKVISKNITTLKFDLHNPVVKALVGPDLESGKLRSRDGLFAVSQM